MAIIRHLSQQEIQSRFTHYALFAGFVPCYYADEGAGCALDVRNGWPDLLLTVAVAVYGSFVLIVSLLNDDYEPAFPIVITGPIKGA